MNHIDTPTQKFFKNKWLTICNAKNISWTVWEQHLPRVVRVGINIGKNVVGDQPKTKNKNRQEVFQTSAYTNHLNNSTNDFI